MKELALGLIETRGLVAALEAADAALKAADVKLVSKDRVDAGLITIKLVGEVAAVQSAVEAGAAAAKRVGELFGSHVIARPDPELNDILIYLEIDSRKKVKPSKPTKISEAESDDDGESDSFDTLAFESSGKSLDDLTVIELRKLSRTIESFPIQGREISRAGKSELIKLISRIKS